jgi:hypothetical protein
MRCRMSRCAVGLGSMRSLGKGGLVSEWRDLSAKGVPPYDVGARLWSTGCSAFDLRSCPGISFVAKVLLHFRDNDYAHIVAPLKKALTNLDDGQCLVHGLQNSTVGERNSSGIAHSCRGCSTILPSSIPTQAMTATSLPSSLASVSLARGSS